MISVEYTHKVKISLQFLALPLFITVLSTPARANYLETLDYDFQNVDIISRTFQPGLLSESKASFMWPTSVTISRSGTISVKFSGDQSGRDIFVGEEKTEPLFKLLLQTEKALAQPFGRLPCTGTFLASSHGEPVTNYQFYSKTNTLGSESEYLREKYYRLDLPAVCLKSTSTLELVFQSALVRALLNFSDKD